MIMYEEDVKTGLEKYHKYKRDIKEALERIEEIDTSKNHCGGSIARKPENPRPKDKVLLEQIDRADKEMEAIKARTYFLGIADEFIAFLPNPYKTIVVMKYIDLQNAQTIGEQFGYHGRSIYKLIDSLIMQFAIHKRRKL